MNREFFLLQLSFAQRRQISLKCEGVSKTQTTDLENADLEKKKKRLTKGLKFITLASKGCFCICDTSVFSRSLFARSAFSRSAFSSSRKHRRRKRRPRKRRPCKQRPRKQRRVTNTKTAFARERIMAAMNLNPLVRLFFFFCYKLSYDKMFSIRLFVRLTHFILFYFALCPVILGFQIKKPFPL